MKWIERLREKVHAANLPVSPRANLPYPEEGASPRFGDTNESEQDFKRAWDDFRSAVEKEREDALEKVLSLFCKISRRTGNPARLALTLVDNRAFAFAIARALVTDIEKLRRASPNGQLQPNDILNYFAGELKGDLTFGGNLLFAIEGLVAPPLDVQPLLEADLLSSLVIVLYRLLYSADSAMENDTIGITRVTDGGEDENGRIVVEGSVVHIMKALARHPGAAHTLTECDRFQYMFHMVVMGGTTPLLSPTTKREARSAPPVHLAQLYRHVLQILELLLASDNGATAQYIQNQELIEELLTPVKYFVRDTHDASYIVSVVSLIKNAVQLSCRPEAGGICLKNNLKKGHGYDYFVQLGLKLAESKCDVSLESQISDSEVIPPQLIRFLDIIGELAQVGIRTNGVHPGSGIAGKAGKPPSGGQLNSKSENTQSLVRELSLDGKLRDSDSVQVFQDLFLKTEIDALRVELLDRLLRLFASHPDNYGIVQELRTMPLFIQNMGKYTPLLQERVLKVLEYTVISANCIPEQELLSLCYLVQQPMASSLRIAVLTFFEKLLSFDRKYMKVLREVGVMDLLVDDLKKCEPPVTSAQSSSRSRPNPIRASSVGILQLEEHTLSPNLLIFEDGATLGLAWSCLISLLRKSEGNQMMFRKLKGVAVVLPLLAAPRHRSNVLKLLSCLIGEDLSQAHKEELKALIEAVHTSSVKNLEGKQWRVELEAKEDVLWMMWKGLVANPALKISFGDGHGFALLLSVLESIQEDDHSGTTSLLSGLDESEEDSGEGSLRSRKLRTELFSALLHVVIAAVAETPTNRNLLHECLASQNFKRLLRCSGLICIDFEEKFAETLFDLALERVHSPSQNIQGLPILLQQETVGHDCFQLPGVHGSFMLDLNQTLEEKEVHNASAIEVLLCCLLQFSLKLQLRVLIRLKSIARSCPRNQDALCAVGCVGLLLEAIRIMLPNPSSLLTCSLQIVEVLGSFRLSSSDIRTLGRYIWQNRDGSGGPTGKSILETVKRMWSIDFIPESLSLSSFTEFRMSRSGHACIRVPLADRTWPPAAGYSFACWIRLENFKSQAAEPNVPRSNLAGRKLGSTGPILRIFSVCTAEEKSTTCVELYVDSEGLKLVTSPTSFLSFKGVHLEEERWYHLVIVHNKPNALAGLFQSSVAYLYLNGKLCHTGKLGYANTPIGKPLQVIIGTPPAQSEVCPLSWRFGSCYLYEEVLPAPAVFFMYIMGRAYRGLFQDPNMIRFIPQEACGGGNLAILETLVIEQQSSSIVQRGEGSVRAAAGLLKTEGNGSVWDMEKFANIAQLSGRKLIFAFDGTFSNASISTAAVTMVNLVDSISPSASLSGGIPRAAEISGDVHICTPSNIADNMRKVGGVTVVLAMVEASKSSEMLHLALSLLHSVLKYNSRNARAMQRCYGYHLLALFLHRRMDFFDKQCLDLLFKIATCQAAVRAKTLSGTEKPAGLQKAIPLQEPIRQISGVPDSITRLVHADSGLDSVLDVSSNPFKFDDQGSSYGSLFDPAESCGQESSTGPGVSELGVIDTSSDDDDCDVLSNPDMMAHVILDWTLWSIASVATQLAVIGFVGRLVSMKRYRKYNMTVLRRLNLMQHLLVILQRDVQVPVFEAVVELVTLTLKDGFILGELQLVADFVVMTFDPSSSIEGTPVTREPKSNQVKVRNMLLDKLIDLQFSLKSDEVKTEEWNKVVSSKVINYLLDDAVHHHSMGRVVTLLGLCLSSSATFATKFKTTGGYQLLTRVLPSFYDSPDIYFILFKLVFNQSVYPRQPEVRMLDFHALMPADGKFGDICFPELLDVVIAMSRAAFRVSKQSLTAQQSGNFSEFNANSSWSFSDVTDDSGEGLQGVALLHKTYAARLMGGEAAAPDLITSILRFMVDLAKMCHPFTLACKRMEFLESVVDLYFACARSAGRVQAAEVAEAAQAALAHSLQSEQGEDRKIYPEDSLPTNENEAGYEKLSVLSDDEVKLEKTFSGELLASAFPEYQRDTIHHLFYDVTVEVAGSLPKYDEQALRPSSPSIAGQETSPRWGQSDSPTASEVSSSAVTPKVENVGSPVGSFLGAPHEAFSRLRTLSSLAGKSEGDASSRHRSSAFFSSTPRSEVDSMYSDFGASSGRFTPRDSSDVIVTPKLLLQLESLGSSGGSCAAGAGAILDLIAEVLADTLTEIVKGMALVEAAIEAVPLYVGSETMLVFQGLCLGRMVNFLERRLVRDEEEHPKKLDKNRWAPNLDALSWLLVDRAFMGAFAVAGAPIKVLEFLLAMLQLANSDGRVEEAVPAGKGLMALARGGGRQVEPYVQALLKNMNRMVMFCFLHTSSAGVLGEDSLTTSFRRSSDSILRSLDSPRHNGDGAPEAFGPCSQEVDKATVLQLILANKKLIFCASNVDSELLSALCVNVTPLLRDSEQSTRSLAVNVWRALVLHRSPALEDILIWRGTQGAMSKDVLHNGFNLLLTVGFKDFYAWIEGSWDTVWKVLEQRALVVWKEYEQGASRFPAVRIKPLEGRRKMQMTRRLREISKIDHSHRELVAKSRSGLEQVRESIAAELRTLRQDKYGWILHAEREWDKQIQQLVHERGLWPVMSATVDGKPFWQLSTKEGPFRMRKKLERPKRNQNDIYDTNLEGEDTLGLEYDRRESLGREGTPPSLSVDHPEFKIPHLRVNSKDFFLPLDEEDDQSRTDGVDDDDASSAQGQWSDHQPSSDTVQANQVPDISQNVEESLREDPDSVHETEENRPIGDALNMEIDVNEDGEYLIRPFLEPGEKLKFRYNCERVLGLDKRDGIFLIGEQCLYAIDNYYIDKEGCIKEKEDEGDISVIDRALGVPMAVPMPGSNDSQDGMKQSSGSVGEAVPVSWPGGRAWAFSGAAWGKDKVRIGPSMRHTWHKWKLDSVHELLKRQYQLRPVAIEVFSMDGCNELLVFLKNERDEVFKNLLAQNLPRNSMLDTTISGASKHEGNEGGRLFKMLAKSFSKRWQNGEISNFQYLMHLNTLAGRGYNDLTQYPVFPWILADYESEELDLTRPETFRCLEKPMGAHHPSREETFKTRYENWEDPDIPRFHYGSHYSSAGIVLFYLIRLPPFSWENKKLQGGDFDHADRLFSSLHDTWHSASQGNTADVKELIPEFFYLPEFLENRFEFDLGVKQSGEKVEHVELPPWAKGSAREFIRKHREALESQYVSENLHHWIDLIFGYKQRGKAAVEATNMFYHLTYDGAVNIDSVPDPAMKAAILAQINHFGQTPRQLFPKPHPKRRWVPRPTLALVPYSYHTVVPQEIRTVGSGVCQIMFYQNMPYIATTNRVLRPPSYDKYAVWGFPDRSLRFMSYDQDRVLSTHENLHDDGSVTCAGFSRDGQILVTGGEDGVVSVWRFAVPMSNNSPLQLQRALCAHTQAVTCLAVSLSYSLVVSASKDRTVIFWDLTSLEYVRQLPEFPASATALHINDMSGEVVTAVGPVLTVWSVNGDCLAAVNSSSDAILSITSPLVPDWTEAGWYITGHQSGEIQLWRMVFDSHSSTNRMSLLRTKSGSDSFTTPVKPGTRLRPTWIALPPGSGLRRLKSGVEGLEDPTKPICITGGTPEFQLLLVKVLSRHKDPVTALCLGNDLKQLCSGDSGGHVISWTLLEDASKNPPLLGSLSQQLDLCNSCHAPVTTSETSRRYCSNCGQVLCSDCSDILKTPLEDLGHVLPVRVCERCFQARKTTHPLLTEEPMNEKAVVGTEESYLSNSASYNRSESSKF